MESQASSALGKEQVRSPTDKGKHSKKWCRMSHLARHHQLLDARSSSGELSSEKDTEHAAGNYWRVGGSDSGST